MSKIVSSLIVMSLLAATVPAFAVDGVVLINQASVMAAGGFPFKLTEPGSYKLSGNLVVPANTTGIEIDAVDVTLDLNGFTISGPIVCDSTGHNCTQGGGSGQIAGVRSVAAGSTIRNGHVRGFNRGVQGFITGYLVEDIHAISNAQAGIEVTQGVVRRNNASGNQGFGINCIDCVVMENIIASNGNSGLVMGRGTFGSNSIARNGEPIFLSQAVSQNTNSCDGVSC
jgi:hypothetical protein